MISSCGLTPRQHNNGDLISRRSDTRAFLYIGNNKDHISSPSFSFFFSPPKTRNFISKTNQAEATSPKTKHKITNKTKKKKEKKKRKSNQLFFPHIFEMLRAAIGGICRHLRFSPFLGGNTTRGLGGGFGVGLGGGVGGGWWGGLGKGMGAGFFPSVPMRDQRGFYEGVDPALDRAVCFFFFFCFLFFFFLCSFFFSFFFFLLYPSFSYSLSLFRVLWSQMPNRLQTSFKMFSAQKHTTGRSPPLPLSPTSSLFPSHLFSFPPSLGLHTAKISLEREMGGAP